LNETNFNISKQALETNATLLVPSNIVPLVYLDIILNYLDQNEEEQTTPYKIEYTFHTNSWKFIE